MPTPPLKQTSRRAVSGLLGALLFALGGGGLLPAGAQEQPTAGDFRPLFGGTTLDGWTGEGAEPGRFSVSEGAIRIREPGGWLRHADTFSNFVLRFEFRFLTPGADSGLFLRAASTSGFGRAWPNRSYQVQLRDMNAPSNFLPLAHLYRHGMPAGETVHDAASVLAAYRGVGEWHTVEVVADGETLRVSLQGQEVLRAAGIGNASGLIGFQGEAGEVEYRAIEIRELAGR